MIPNSVLLNSKSIYYMMVDSDGNYLRSNKNFLDRFDCHGLETKKLKVEDIILKDDLDIVKGAIANSLISKGKHQNIVIRKPVNDEILYTQWEFVCYEEDKDVIHCMGFDISQRISISSKLEKQSILLSEIAYQQSHQMRGPLARLLGLIELIKQEPHNKLIIEHLSNVGNEIDELIHSIIHKTE